MSVIIGLICVALVLVFFEVILPGGILGVIAAVCVIVATWIAAVDYGASAAVGIFLGSLIAIALFTYLEFKVLARTSLGERLFLKSAVSGHSNEAPAEASIIGKEGHALTRLNPSGKVAIDGRSYEAYSQDGYVDAEARVRVASQDSFKLIIEKI